MDNVPRPIPNQRRRLHCRPIVRRRRRRRRRLCCRGRKVARKSSFVRSVGRSVFARSKSAYLLYYETRSSGSLSVHPRTLPANTTRSCNRKMAWEISGRVEPEIEMPFSYVRSIVFRVAMRLKLCLSPVHPMSSVDRTLDAPKNAIVEGKFGTLN